MFVEKQGQQGVFLTELQVHASQVWALKLGRVLYHVFSYRHLLLEHLVCFSLLCNFIQAYTHLINNVSTTQVAYDGSFNPISTGLFCLVVALGGVFSTPLS